MANIIIGRKDSTGPVLSTPKSPPIQPHWNTATSTPNAAPTDTRIMSAAFRGTRIERNTAASNTKLRPITMAKNSGMTAEILSATSMKTAVEPPTRTSASCPATAAGSRWRSPLTSASVASSCGEVFGMTLMMAADESWLNVRGDTAATPSTWPIRPGKVLTVSNALGSSMPMATRI